MRNSLNIKSFLRIIIPSVHILIISESTRLNLELETSMFMKKIIYLKFTVNQIISRHKKNV